MQLVAQKDLMCDHQLSQGGREKTNKKTYTPTALNKRFLALALDENLNTHSHAHTRECNQT